MSLIIMLTSNRRVTPRIIDIFHYFFYIVGQLVKSVGPVIFWSPPGSAAKALFDPERLTTCPAGSLLDARSKPAPPSPRLETYSSCEKTTAPD
jgi:hypothetical protein